MIDLNFRLPKILRYAKRLEEAVDRAAKSTARYVVKDNVRRIDEHIDYRGKAQQQNKPATRRYKARKLGHTTPLRWSGRLATEDAYSISRRSKGRWIVELPPDRVNVVGHLRRRGYSYFGVSEEALAHWDVEFKRAMRKGGR